MAGNAPLPSILILGGEETERLVTAALGELPIRVDRLEDRDDFGQSHRRSDLVLLQRAPLPMQRAPLVEPETVRDWLEAGILDPTVPLLLLASGPVSGDEYRDWLAAGVWEIFRLPIDPAILALRLRNLLDVRWSGSQPSLAPNMPYPWPTLLRATGEVLALGKRHARPTACVAVAVEQVGGRGDEEGGSREPSRRLMHRLGVAAQQWVRDSDLVGLTGQEVLLAVLPDTTGDEAAILAPRLMAALERSLRRAKTVAALRSAIRSAPEDGSESAADFLLQAVRRVT
jgi:hypothetical protein